MSNSSKPSIKALQRQLEDVTAERDSLATSLSQMSTHFEEIIAAQTMALAEARDQALSASKTKSEFLANMSHEIRTPLTAIIGFANSLNDESLSDDDTALATASIIRNSHHLMNIINDILDLAKIEQQEFELEQMPFNLIELVSEVEESVSGQALEKDLWLKLHFTPPLPKTIISDPTWLKQILLNLVGNALKFTQLGGVDIKVEYSADINEIAIAVTDTGIGINDAQKERIFDPFSQADTTTTRRYGGTGLGLTICTKLAQLMNGRLTVDSTPNQGSTFTFSFNATTLEKEPLLGSLEQIQSQQAQVKSHEITIPNLGGKVLLAEDSLDTQNLVAMYIKKTGAQVIFADDGQQAFEQALAGDFDLVLMDIQMPVIDGLEATRLLRQIGFQKPIIAFTANAEKQELARSLAAGCDGHMLKPININAFYETLKEFLPPGDSDNIKDRQVNLINDEELNIIRSSFINRTPKFVKELTQSVNEQNWTHAKTLVHTLKGTCGSLGFKSLYTVIKQLEDQLKSQPKQCHPLLLRLTDELKHTQKQLAEKT